MPNEADRKQMALVPLLFAPWGLPLDSSAASGPRLLELEAAAAGPRKAKNPKHQATVDAFWEAQDAGKGAEFLDKILVRINVKYMKKYAEENAGMETELDVCDAEVETLTRETEQLQGTSAIYEEVEALVAAPVAKPDVAPLFELIKSSEGDVDESVLANAIAGLIEKRRLKEEAAAAAAKAAISARGFEEGDAFSEAIASYTAKISAAQERFEVARSTWYRSKAAMQRRLDEWHAAKGHLTGLNEDYAKAQADRDYFRDMNTQNLFREEQDPHWPQPRHHGFERSEEQSPEEGAATEHGDFDMHLERARVGAKRGSTLGGRLFERESAEPRAVTSHEAAAEKARGAELRTKLQECHARRADAERARDAELARLEQSASEHADGAPAALARKIGQLVGAANDQTAAHAPEKVEEERDESVTMEVVANLIKAVHGEAAAAGATVDGDRGVEFEEGDVLAEQVVPGLVRKLEGLQRRNERIDAEQEQLRSDMATADAAVKGYQQKIAELTQAIQKMRESEAAQAHKLKLYYHYHCTTLILKQPHLQQRHRKHGIEFKTAADPVYVMAGSIREHPHSTAFNRKHGITLNPLIEVLPGDPRPAAQSRLNARRAEECRRRRETPAYATWLAAQKAASAEVRRSRKITHPFY